MAIEKVGELPVNSRIFIDYTQSPPKIDFEYPDKDTSVVRRSSVTVLIAMSLAIFIILGYILLSESNVFHFSGTNINHAYLYNNDSLWINYSIDGKTHSTKISPTYNGFFWKVVTFRSDDLRANLEIIAQAFILIILFILLTWLFSRIIGLFFKNTKVGQRTFPELNKRMHDKHYSADFASEDVVDNKVELPLFKNMYMDYEATGDFSEQLIKISIIEHPFSHLVRRHGHYMYKKEKKKPQVYLWKAIFEFKEKPKDGKLEIHFT